MTNKIIEKVVAESQQQPPNTPSNNIKDNYTLMYDPQDKARWFVKLLPKAGDWAGIMYSYGAFSIKEPEASGGAAMFSFERDILYVPEHLRGKEFPDSSNTEFTILLGKILYDILQDNLDKASHRDGKLVLELAKDD